MTSDAKVGLLLGLVFIFIIAFIINGLPSFREDGNNNELTTNMVGLQNNPPAIAAKEREAINLRKPVGKEPPEVGPPSTGNQDIRFTTALPKSSLVVKETTAVKPAAHAPAEAEKDESYRTKSNEVIRPKIYVVNEGDSLAVIAQKFYGPREGNKRINIARIFDANHKLLKSPDEIYVGQKLIIPPLVASVPDKGKIATVFSATEFAKVESIGKRRLLTNGRRVEQSRWHIVREGDNLWQIAAEQLGDGSRYGEIAELNADILDNEDNLSVGMRLRMPAR